MLFISFHSALGNDSDAFDSPAHRAGDAFDNFASLLVKRLAKDAGYTKLFRPVLIAKHVINVPIDGTKLPRINRLVDRFFSKLFDVFASDVLNRFGQLLGHASDLQIRNARKGLPQNSLQRVVHHRDVDQRRLYDVEQGPPLVLEEALDASELDVAGAQEPPPGNVIGTPR